MPDAWVLLWHSWHWHVLTAQHYLGTCAPLASVFRGQWCFSEQRRERVMLPCMCHGHGNAPAGTGDTPGEPDKGLGKHSQHSGKALCQPFPWKGFILGLQGAEAASEMYLQYSLRCLCVKSCKWLCLIKENGIPLRKSSTSGVRLDLLGSVCWPSCTR